MRTFALFVEKALDFSKFIVFLHGQEGREMNQGGKGSIIRDFCWRLLWTAPNIICTVYCYQNA